MDLETSVIRLRRARSWHPSPARTATAGMSPSARTTPGSAIPSPAPSAERREAAPPWPRPRLLRRLTGPPSRLAPNHRPTPAPCSPWAACPNRRKLLHPRAPPCRATRFCGNWAAAAWAYRLTRPDNPQTGPRRRSQDDTGRRTRRGQHPNWPASRPRPKPSPACSTEISSRSTRSASTKGCRS